MPHRLLLAPVDTGDVDELYPIFGDPAGWWYEPSNRHQDRGQTCAWIAKAAARWESDGLSYWTVRLVTTGEAIGIGGVQRRPSGSWNLYYRLTTQQWGKGYATELGRAALSAAHACDKAVSTAAWIAENNLPSRRVAERLELVDYGSMVDDNDGAARLVYADRRPDELAP